MSKAIVKEDGKGLQLASEFKADEGEVVKVPIVVEGEEVGHVEYTQEEYEHVTGHCEEHGLTLTDLVLRHMASKGYRVGGEDS